MTRPLLAAVPFVVCALLYATAMRGHFLSDDMAVIYVLSEWLDKGELWTRLFAKFASGLDAPSHYYRPLAFLTYGVNLLTGMNPLSWHLVNLAGHLLGGVAVYRISALLLPETDGRTGAVFAAALFLLCATSAEPVAWISGRYDVFATALSLWAGALSLQSRSWRDRYAVAALLCGILALTSKESGLIAPVLIGVLSWIKHRESDLAARWRATVLDIVPWAVLVAGYFAMRLALFGSMLQVYPGTRPLQRFVDGSWVVSPQIVWSWLLLQIPSRPTLILSIVLITVMAAYGIAALFRQRDLLRAFVGIFGAMLASLVMLLPHLTGLAANGEGGRLVYTTSALLALLGGLLWTACARLMQSRAIAVALAGVGVALIAVQAALLDVALAAWRSAGVQMGQLVVALPVLSASIASDGYAIVIAPDSIGPVPFARNANGAMALPPIQAEPLLSKLIVFLPRELPNVPSLLRQGLIPTLKRYSLGEATERFKQSAATVDAAGVVWPSDVFCWPADGSQMKKLPLPANLSAQTWVQAMRTALRNAGCDRVR